MKGKAGDNKPKTRPRYQKEEGTNRADWLRPMYQTTIYLIETLIWPRSVKGA